MFFNYTPCIEFGGGGGLQREIEEMLVVSEFPLREAAQVKKRCLWFSLLWDCRVRRKQPC